MKMKTIIKILIKTMKKENILSEGTNLLLFLEKCKKNASKTALYLSFSLLLFRNSNRDT